MTAATVRLALQQAQTWGLARIDAQMLLLHALGRALHERAWLIAHDDELLPPALASAYAALCERRLGGEPVAYLTGRKAFHGLELQVDARVLDPRPDTETLVDWALHLLRPLSAPQVADLGTGSGAVALAIKAQQPQAQLTAIDASSEALAVAEGNARRLGLPLRLRHGNWLEGCATLFDLIVSNPPYIAEGDAHLAALGHEPRMALVSGADGLDAICQITAQAPAHLKPGGWLLLEHGHDQAGQVQGLMQECGFTQVQSRKDLAGITRCTGGAIPLRPITTATAVE
ncbi:peptide chain release factor N(5)-glutamine methyltransferase [Comamonas sp. NLF-1-9]|uniref:peptide chain release factor N(5)-glutamine methyltransferase n=1 Tax=Comamonas sp. NLF-1-9 TaxID=2853163 RepID=UPI001C468D68|nr:peptide chain release factor N(5)-glutamine methyltransferase [Comamonas sp. NLF-1-9]QXL85474.1 peptide chain release factor N(5)-glutamine methyltransferase [Comamonas sp. NLF-1-9]